MNARELVTLHTSAYRAGSLPIYVITKNPQDYPGKYVVRVQFPTKDPRRPIAVGPVIAVVGNLRAARRALDPLPVVRMQRHPDDDPVIVETWL
jgi:hypothetical protein